MTKIKFLMSLHDKLSGLPQDEVEERLNFYSEMIEDRMEEGVSEDEAVAAIGTVDEVASQILAEIPLVKIAKEKIKPKRRLKAWEITMLVLTSPVWVSLLLAAFAIILSLYISLWSIVISLWSVFVSLAACLFASIVICILFSVTGHTAAGFATLGAGAVCAGLAIFMFYGCRAFTKVTVILGKKIAIGIKKCFI